MALLGAVAMVLATPTSIASARWWRSYLIVEALGLTPRQADAIEIIYDRMGAEAEACERDASAARQAFDRVLMGENVDDVPEVTAARLADAEAACRRTRTVMLFKMYRELSADQRRLLAAIADGANRRRR